MLLVTPSEMKNPRTGHNTEKTNKGTKETRIRQLGPDLSQVMEGRRGEKGERDKRSHNFWRKGGER